MVRSGVGAYLEFKPVEKIFYLHATDTNKGAGAAAAAGGAELALYPVPCSKSEVFRDKLLSTLDKRGLTQFLQVLLPLPSPTR